ncbi:MAG: tRNA pseudouridine(38-40) synthase TruA [Candidatus Aceula meridiana]|nr:tRNA pseudouridine(38-40) synthase TruA [Candidatus Aceula meridiana]
MRIIKLTIEYNGTNFCGWQVQRKGQRTVQGEIKKALKRLLKEEVTLVGSGRTDSGVHALAQVAHFTTSSSMDNKKLLNALNANLPKDIAIIAAKEVPEGFHAQHSPKSKTYRYSILNRSVRSVLAQDFVYFYPYPLNLNLIRKEAKTLIGKKDFKAFVASDPALKKQGKAKTTIRTITKIVVRKSKGLVEIDITANGFLYKMVRNIVGTLIKAGEGKFPKGSIRRILNSKNRQMAGPTAPAKGLCLLKVTY